RRGSSRGPLATAGLTPRSAGSTTAERGPAGAGGPPPPAERGGRRRPGAVRRAAGPRPAGGTGGAETPPGAPTPRGNAMRERPRSLDREQRLAERRLVHVDAEPCGVRQAGATADGGRGAGGDPLSGHLAREVAGEQQLRGYRGGQVRRRRR